MADFSGIRRKSSGLFLRKGVRSGDDAGGGSVRSVQDHAGEVSEAMGFRGHGVVLVRPDRVASLFSGALDGTEVRRWFDSL